MAIIGTAFVRVRPDASGFEKETNKGLMPALKRAAGLATAAFASAKVGSYFKDAISQSSDLNETVSKSRNIFGGSSAGIERWSKASAGAFGLSQSAALAATSQFGNMFQQLGFTEKQSASTSKSLVKTAADLGSFNNVDPSDVLDRIGASLRGEYDSLQQLIPNINAARVEHEALSATGKKSAKDLTAQEKATATLAIIQRDGAKAAGDFAETSGGLANQQRIASAQALDLKAKLGDALRPALEDLAHVGTTQLMPFLIDLAERYGPKVGEVLSDAAASAGPFLKSLREGPNPETASAFGDLTGSLREMGPALRDVAEQAPSFADTLSVGSTVVAFLADHIDELQAALPYLAVGFIAVKVAQIAGNAAAAASIPLRIAEVIGNQSLAAAVRANTAAITGQTGATNVGIIARARAAAATAASTVQTVLSTAATRIASAAAWAWTAATNSSAAAAVRQAAATAASRVVAFAAAAATRAWAATQWLLNAALTANPIGLVIAAIALLVGGLVLAYKRSETFRNIVNGAFGAVATAATALWENAIKPAFRFIVNMWLTVAQAILDGAATAFGWVPGIGPKLKNAAREFTKFKDRVNAALSQVEDKHVTVSASVATGVSRKLAANPRLIGRASGGSVKGPGTETSDSILAALSNDEHVWSAREVKGAGGHTAMERMRAAARAGELPAFASGGRVGLQVHPKTGSTRALAQRVRELDADLDQVATDLGRRLADQLAPAASVGMGYRKQMQILRSRFPGLAMNSGPRPGARTVSGNQSYHALGRAVDVPPRMDVFNWLLANYGRSSKELIFSPAGNRQIKNGRSHYYSGAVRSMHFNHVHWAYDRGGMLPSGRIGINRSGRPERVLSPEQTQAFERLVTVLEDGGGTRRTAPVVSYDGANFYSYDPIDVVRRQRTDLQDAAATFGLSSLGV